MKIYNNNLGKVEELAPTILCGNVHKFTNKMTEEELNSWGYYKIVYNTYPDRRYYVTSINTGIVDGKYVVSYTTADKPLDAVKSRILKEVSESFKQVSERPSVYVESLDITVDGSRMDMGNFEIGKKHGITSIKDANGNTHTIDDAGYDAILYAIEQNGLNLYFSKWDKESAIKALNTLEDLIIYEHTPYEVEEEEVDENGDPTGETVTVTKYKNMVTEW